MKRVRYIRRTRKMISLLIDSFKDKFEIEVIGSTKY